MSIFVQPELLQVPPPPAPFMNVPVLVFVDIVPVPDPPEPVVGFGFTHVSLRHSRPGSQLPPCVQAHFSLPTGHSPSSAAGSPAAQLTDAPATSPTNPTRASQRRMRRR